MTTLGLVHLVFGITAVLTGTIVIFMRKGTRLHRTIGHFYFTSMLGTNITALFIYRLTGTFNFFHIAAFLSLIFLSIGMGTVIFRRPKKSWLNLHGALVTGSYVGVLSAFFSEITTRIPGIHFGLAVGATTAVVTAIGVYFIMTRMDFAIRNMKPRRASN
jgi:uncharacterized membrane protein